MGGAAKYQVIGNFSPGQFSFKTKKEAMEWAKFKRKQGFRVSVSKIIRTISSAERKRFEAHKKRVIAFSMRKRR